MPSIAVNIHAGRLNRGTLELDWNNHENDLSLCDQTQNPITKPNALIKILFVMSGRKLTFSTDINNQKLVNPNAWIKIVFGIFGNKHQVKATRFEW